jgi:hypothetical protein
VNHHIDVLVDGVVAVANLSWSGTLRTGDIFKDVLGRLALVLSHGNRILTLRAFC